MRDHPLMPALVVGALLAVGLIGSGAFVGQGLVNARIGDRSVTVRGLAERDVRADLAVLPLRFTASGDVLSEVQGRIDGDLVIVRRFLTAQGYPEDAVSLGRLEVADTRSREYASQSGGPRFILAQTVGVRSTDVDRVQATSRALNELVRQGVVLQDYAGPTYIFTRLNAVRRGHGLGPDRGRAIRQGFRRAPGADPPGQPGLVPDSGPRRGRRRKHVAGQEGAGRNDDQLSPALGLTEPDRSPERVPRAGQPAARSDRPAGAAYPAGSAAAGEGRPGPVAEATAARPP